MKTGRIKLVSILLILVLTALSAVSCGADGKSVAYGDIPPYAGEPYAVINGNKPFFTREEITDRAYESYSRLDALGRCGVAMACVGRELMPTEERESLSAVNPTGLVYKGRSNNNKYSFIDGTYVYNRCHLIGFQLTGENANEENLITGTRYFNIEGMLPFENMIADFVREGGKHVMLRVTPYYLDYDYVARGVLMEGYSVEDRGEEICFCVFVYNVQPGVIIDYFTGENKLDPESGHTEEEVTSAPTYVLNFDSMKYHLPDCYHAENMKEEYRINYDGSVADFKFIHRGYAPCGICKPDEYR